MPQRDGKMLDRHKCCSEPAVRDTKIAVVLCCVQELTCRYGHVSRTTSGATILESAFHAHMSAMIWTTVTTALTKLDAVSHEQQCDYHFIALSTLFQR